MIKKVSIGIAFVGLVGALVVQYSYIKYQEKKFAEISKEHGHARTIHILQGVLERIDEKGNDYARRAVFIARAYEEVKLERWVSEKSIELSEPAKDLLLKVEAYDKKNRVRDK
ncbi:MAG TPA: hypothetical protein ENI17_15760 [Pseudomonas xinjiangensis]|uniref:Uncharacterized protein n=2 Tax=root TaxID=1 RepID=A0A7V1BN78_9GAMM|nr:hypothetical protein [Halopseudomonas xinjiangensis]HEC49057.1 hypothetical protein [Halopseudomonas xinjiangensis]